MENYIIIIVIIILLFLFSGDKNMMSRLLDNKIFFILFITYLAYNNFNFLIMLVIVLFLLFTNENIKKFILIKYKDKLSIITDNFNQYGFSINEKELDEEINEEDNENLEKLLNEIKLE